MVYEKTRSNGSRFRNSVQRRIENREDFDEKQSANRQDFSKVLRYAENKERQGLYARIEVAGESQCVGGPSIFWRCCLMNLASIAHIVLETLAALSALATIFDAIRSEWERHKRKRDGSGLTGQWPVKYQIFAPERVL